MVKDYSRKRCKGVAGRGRQDTQHNYNEHNDIRHNDIRHNDIRHNDTQHKGLSITLLYGQCHCAGCCVLLNVMLSVITLNVNMLSRCICDISVIVT